MSDRADSFSSDLSNTQSNRAEHLVCTALQEIQAFGTSRKEAKQELYDAGFKSSHDVNSKIGITSFATYDKVKSTATMFTKFCFENFGIKNLNQIKPTMIKSFFNDAIERDCSQNTCKSYASGINKFAQAIDKLCPISTPRTETWNSALSECREMVRMEAPERDLGTRAYNNPQAIINALLDEKLKVCAEMQLSHGLRLADATKINVDENGVLTVLNSKNGQDMQIKLSDSEVQRIKEVSNGSMSINVKQSTYREALHIACDAAGQDWNGTHGMRHNFAQDRMAELQGEGMSYNQALAQVSAEMGHHRLEITEIYMR